MAFIGLHKKNRVHKYKIGICAVLITIASSVFWPMFSHVMVVKKLNALSNLKLKQQKDMNYQNYQHLNITTKLKKVQRLPWKAKKLWLISNLFEQNVVANVGIVNSLKTSAVFSLCSCSNESLNQAFVKKFNVIKSKNICQLYENHASIIMPIVFDLLPFNNPDGGVWKQGYLIETSDEEWQGKILKVFVVPHSHNDPGWIKTVDQYFTEQTKYILNNVVDFLSKNKLRRFVWAEVSFLSMWQSIASQERAAKMKQLLQNGQIEIVTGGWVMNDEANTHYFAMIDQMIEGSQWVKEFYGIIPTNAWSIDPFGHSSVMAYLLEKMNFENMVIQRTHYSVKKFLSVDKSLEFRWQQFWNSKKNGGILCHMMPFFSYDIPHTCGPDPSACCQFDFARLKHMPFTCPWGIQPVSINKRNVKKRSLMLLDQYRKKAKLFRTNILLVPLGDDFRYAAAADAKAQFENYEKLFKYINSKPGLNAQIQFGTLSEYFAEMRKEIGDLKKLPGLVGDFFTYADRDDHYWSGYYTSRPFYKRQERKLESYLRGAGILYSLAIPYAKLSDVWKIFSTAYYKLIVKARRSLGLFQHHDGITGTSKPKVVLDYAEKLIESIKDIQKVLAASVQILLAPKFSQNTVYFAFNEIYVDSSRLPKCKVLQITPAFTTVVIYNSLPYPRKDVVSLCVSSTKVLVENSQFQYVTSQIRPKWRNLAEMESNLFQLDFEATVPALGLAYYFLRSKENRDHFEGTASVTFYNNPRSIHLSTHKSFRVETIEKPKSRRLVLENSKIQATFSTRTGFLKSVFDKQSGVETKAAVSFGKYRTKMSRQKSGAYIFYPTGKGVPHHPEDKPLLFRHVQGELYSEVFVELPALIHRVIFYYDKVQLNHPEALHIQNLINLTKSEDNLEISMRIASDVESGPYFYTDLNGFHVVRRKTYTKLPLQANFYPMPTMSFIQDKFTRLTLLTAQPLGVASLQSGELEIMLDRRPLHDDMRGLGQGVVDNVPTAESFVLLLEKWEPEHSMRWDSDLGYPSMLAHQLSWELLHPLSSMSLDSTKKSKIISLRSSYSGLNVDSWPCDVHLVNLRSLTATESYAASDQAALILHRVGYECGLSSHRLFQASCYANGYEVAATFLRNYDIILTSLSLLHDREKVNFTLAVDQMEIEAFKIKLKIDD